MRTIILADIHANETALRAVLEAAGKFDRMVFFGDLLRHAFHQEALKKDLKQMEINAKKYK